MEYQLTLTLDSKERSVKIVPVNYRQDIDTYEVTIDQEEPFLISKDAENWLADTDHQPAKDWLAQIGKAIEKL